ncbi:MAG: alpha-L-fucosidase [Ruminococcaceae bacterium]|nr:alpha-L-fucosidase [Oscillospiraceae bacterium]
MAIPQPTQRVADYENMGLGMFVHWGLYSQLEKDAWGFWIYQYDMAEYKKAMDTFTAEDFDAEKLVLTAKNAGCRYIVLTTRHHEGFSLYDTCGLNAFDVMHAPAGRDLIREYVDACNKHGIVPFFYHTTLDWYHPDYRENFDKYLGYLRDSVEVLCKNYGKIGGFWFDGNWDDWNADWKEGELYAVIRKYQPDAIIINNSGLRRIAVATHPEIDAVVFEQGHPKPLEREGAPKYLAAELCLPMNDHWGYVGTDWNYKSPKTIIEALCDARRVGANFLVNVSPDGQGGIVPMQSLLMQTVGDWMKLYGEAIYRGRPCAAKSSGRNYALRSDDALYLMFYDLGEGGNKNVTVNADYFGWQAFDRVTDEIVSVEWMDNGEKLDFIQQGEMLSVGATGYPFGTHTLVRVAKAIIKK